MDITIKEEERIREFFSLFNKEELAYIANWAIQAYEMPDKKPSEGQSSADFLIDLFKSLGEGMQGNFHMMKSNTQTMKRNTMKNLPTQLTKNARLSYIKNC